MKRIFAFILSILYLTTSVGATVHFHYCMDKMVKWGLAADEESTCVNCGMHKGDSKGCCKDDQKQIKVEGEQKAASFLISTFNSPIDVPVTLIAHYLGAYSFSSVLKNTVSHSPPDKAPIPIYLHNCLFRI